MKTLEQMVEVDMRFPVIIPDLLVAVSIGAGATVLASAADSDTVARIDLGATRRAVGACL